MAVLNDKVKTNINKSVLSNYGGHGHVLDTQSITDGPTYVFPLSHIYVFPKAVLNDKVKTNWNKSVLSNYGGHGTF